MKAKGKGKKAKREESLPTFAFFLLPFAFFRILFETRC